MAVDATRNDDDDEGSKLDIFQRNPNRHILITPSRFQ